VDGGMTLTEKKNGDLKESFYEELEQVFSHISKYHMDILLGDFNAKVGREDIFKLIIGMRVSLIWHLITGAPGH
jgi:hypothetical protein